MSPEAEARLARAMALRAGPRAALRRIAPASIAIVICEGRQRLYADPLDADALRDRRQAWALVAEVHRARRRLRDETEAGERVA